ncbi:MAG: hypothetical protein AAGB35_00875, partial [Pseudomonadota bacterium]
MRLPIPYFSVFYILSITLLFSYIPIAVSQEVNAENKSMEMNKATSRKSIEWWNSNFEVDPDNLFASGYRNHQ